MDNVDKSVDKWIFQKMGNPQTLGITSLGQIAQLVEQRTENPCPSSNISDLAPKTVRTIADKLRTIWYYNTERRKTEKLKAKWDFTWRVSDHEELVGGC